MISVTHPPDPRVDNRCSIDPLLLTTSDLFLVPCASDPKTSLSWTIFGRLPATWGKIQKLGLAHIQLYDLEDRRLDSYRISLFLPSFGAHDCFQEQSAHAIHEYVQFAFGIKGDPLGSSQIRHDEIYSAHSDNIEEGYSTHRQSLPLSTVTIAAQTEELLSEQIREYPFDKLDYIVHLLQRRKERQLPPWEGKGTQIPRLALGERGRTHQLFLETIEGIMSNHPPSTYGELLEHPDWKEAISLVDASVTEGMIALQESLRPFLFPPSILGTYEIRRRSKSKDLSRIAEKQSARGAFIAFSDLCAFRVVLKGKDESIRQTIAHAVKAIETFVIAHGGKVYHRPPFIQQGVEVEDIIAMIRVYLPHYGFTEIQVGHEFAFCEFSRESMLRSMAREGRKWPERWDGIFWNTFIPYAGKSERLYSLIERKILNPTSPIQPLELLKEAYASQMGVKNVSLEQMHPDVVSPEMIQILQRLSHPEIDTYKHLKCHKRGNCIALAKHLAFLLEKKYQARIVLSSLPASYTQPDFPVQSHAAVLLPALDGCVLLDPGLPIGKPVPLTEGNPISLQSQGKTWTFRLEGKKIQAHMQKGDFAEAFTYDLATLYPADAPLDDAITLPITQKAKSISICRNDGAGNLFASLSIKLDTQMIYLRLRESGQLSRLPLLSFAQFMRRGFTHLTGEQRERLSMLFRQRESSLEEKIRFLIQNLHLL